MKWITKLISASKAGKLSKDGFEELPTTFTSPEIIESGALYRFPKLSFLSNYESLIDWACDPDIGSQQALYLAQLCDEGLADTEGESFIILWESIFFLHNSADHIDSLQLLGLPKIKRSILSVSERGTVTDPNFQININGILDKNNRITPFVRSGAVFSAEGSSWLISPAEWLVVKKISEFSKIQADQKNRKINEKFWGDIRPACMSAGVALSKYLKETVVITQDSLDVFFMRSNHQNIEVVAIEPTFESAPVGWLNAFDRWKEVPSEATFPTEGGSTLVILSEPVREILTIIKKDFPFRRATGARAQAFIRNPFAFLGGEVARQVLKERQIEKAKESAGIVPTSIRLFAYIEKDGSISKVSVMITQNTSNGELSNPRKYLENPDELRELLNLMKSAVNDELQVFNWNGHQIDVDGDIYHQITTAESYLRVWENQKNNFILFTDIYSLENYGEQIEGIGEAKPIYSPYIQKGSGPWTPENIQALIKVNLPPNGASTFIQLDMEWVESFRKLILAADIEKAEVVIDPRLPLPLSISDAKKLLAQLEILIASGGREGDQPIPPTTGGGGIDQPPGNPLSPAGGDGSGRGSAPGPGGEVPPEGSTPIVKKKPKETLILKDRIGELNYSETEDAEDRGKVLGVPANFSPYIPPNKRPEIEFKNHQLIGVAWLQHLYSLSPNHVRGAILADDMGLGKTLQLLTLLAAHYHKRPNDPPSLVIAPIALMKNWINEADKFYEDFPEILLLHGENLEIRKQPKSQIDKALQEKKITNLLKPNWLGEAKVVLATYEVLRDFEFSLARQDFVYMICDEAQKIKTPNAMVTLAAKKQKAKFRIACTGTPVENSLADLWCLFDFVQPGLLGSLEEFSKKFRRPIESKSEGFQKTLALLRSYIEPQILRRMKTDKDIVPDLRRKHQVENDKYVFEEKERSRLKIPISTHQIGLYADGLRQLEAAAQEKNAKRRANMSFAVLHFIKAVCAEPYCLPGRTFQIDAGGRESHLFNSPKLKWTIKQLREIAQKNEKVIIFTEIREIQRALIQFIRQEFGFTPLLINGEVDERQDVVDAFQAKPGFGVIVLSPLAAGFGLNIVEANHVIHYSRTWNPAKEGQATDRAYRIGQKRDVFVYCPTIVADDFVTFEDKLDRLMTLKADLAGDMLDGVGADISAAQLFPTDGPGGAGLRNATGVVDIDYVDTLDGESFEVFCKILLGHGAIKADLTAKSGDGGIDLIIIGYEGQGMLCQCKHTSSNELGWDAVKEVAAGSQAYLNRFPTIKFQKVAICNRAFNKSAREQALNLGVRLIERSEIIQLLKDRKILKSVIYEAILRAFS